MAEPTQIKQIINEVYNARQRNDAKEASRKFHPECTFRIAGHEGLGGLTKSFSGRVAIESVLERLCADWDFSELQTMSIHVDGDTAYCHRRGRIRHIPNGQAFETELVDKLTFRDGQVVEFVEFVDTHRVAQIVSMPQS